MQYYPCSVIRFCHVQLKANWITYRRTKKKDFILEEQELNFVKKYFQKKFSRLTSKQKLFCIIAHYSHQETKKYNLFGSFNHNSIMNFKKLSPMHFLTNFTNEFLGGNLCFFHCLRINQLIYQVLINEWNHLVAHDVNVCFLVVFYTWYKRHPKPEVVISMKNLR